MPLAVLSAPFDHQDRIFEPKLDGFRAVCYIEQGTAHLVSRNRNAYNSFPTLTAALASALRTRDTILDCEIAHLGPDGTPRFYDLMRRRSPRRFYACDVLWLDGHELRTVPLLERKRILRKLVPPQPSPILYVDHVVASGGALYSAVCLRDTEVAKLGNGTHTPDATTWSRSRIPTIAKRRGRADFFQAGA